MKKNKDRELRARLVCAVPARPETYVAYASVHGCASGEDIEFEKLITGLKEQHALVDTVRVDYWNVYEILLENSAGYRWFERHYIPVGEWDGLPQELHINTDGFFQPSHYLGYDTGPEDLVKYRFSDPAESLMREFRRIIKKGTSQCADNSEKQSQN